MNLYQKLPKPFSNNFKLHPKVRNFHVVHRSIHRNLVEAFGAEPSIFWHLTLDPKQKMPNLDQARKVGTSGDDLTWT